MSATVLIVEDERIVADDLQCRLERLGYTVVANVGEADEAIAIAETMRPQVVLMDIQLAGKMDGIIAAKEIRSRFGCPIIFLTAHSDDRTLQRAVESEPLGYILKPFHERELRTSIEIGLYKHAMEQKLKESEEWFATTLASIGDAVIATDQEGMIKLVNPSAEKLTGWRNVEAVGVECSAIIRLLDSKTREVVENPILLAIRNRRGVGIEADPILIQKNGSEIPIDVLAAPIKDMRGLVTGAVLTFRDITQRRQLEETLRQAYKLDAVGRLAGGVAHDFNNIMTAILGHSELLLDEIHPDDPKHTTLCIIRDSGARAAAITGQLLAFSRKQLLSPVVLNLNVLLDGLTKMLRRFLVNRIELSLVLASDLRMIEVDPIQMQQVLMILAVNAREAMPEGGELRIETANTVVDTQHALRHAGVQPGQYVMLKISDTGVGMSQEVKKQVFEPFFTTKEVGQGTGLGLATVYGIVQQSGGHIEFDSEVGLGTRFRIYLPVVTEPASKTPTAEPASVHGNETVLVVDDEDAVRELIVRVLTDSGYVVLSAKDGEEALRFIRDDAHVLDLLLCDVVMPTLSGCEVAKQSALLRPGMKCLFMSGYTDDSLAASGVLLPNISFIQKPFRNAELLQRVRGLLNQANIDQSVL